MAAYFVRRRGGSPEGPISKTEISRQVAAGALLPEDLVGANIDGPWAKVATVRQLAPLIPARAPRAAARVEATKGPSVPTPAEPRGSSPAFKLFAALLVTAATGAAMIPILMLASKSRSPQAESTPVVEAMKSATDTAESPRATAVADLPEAGSSGHPGDAEPTAPTLTAAEQPADDAARSGPTATPPADVVSRPGEHAPGSEPTTRPEPDATVAAGQPADPPVRQRTPDPVPSPKPPPDPRPTCDQFASGMLKQFSDAAEAHREFLELLKDRSKANNAKLLAAALDRANASELALIRIQIPDHLQGCQPGFVLRERLAAGAKEYEEQREFVVKTLTSTAWQQRLARSSESAAMRLLQAATVRRSQLHDRLPACRIDALMHAMNAHVAYVSGDVRTWIVEFSAAVEAIDRQDPFQYYLATKWPTGYGAGHMFEVSSSYWTMPDSMLGEVMYRRWVQERGLEAEILDRVYRRGELPGGSFPAAMSSLLQQDVFQRILGPSRSDGKWNARAAREQPAEYEPIRPYTK